MHNRITYAEDRVFSTEIPAALRPGCLWKRRATARAGVAKATL